MEVYGLIGEKLGHSLSPRIHEMLFQQLGITGTYKLLEIPATEFDRLSGTLKLLKIRGANVTIPYKQRIMTQLDEITPEARRIGAVNTVLLSPKNQRLVGSNTDYFGFQALLAMEKIQVAGKRAAILGGTGGAAQAVKTLLLDGGIEKLYLVSRWKTGNWGQDPRLISIDYGELRKISGDILINSTPVGMYPQIGVSPVELGIISRFKILVDLVYNPQETEFLRLGQVTGKQRCGGLYMLVAQAAKSQELWQQRAIGEAVISAVYQRLIRERAMGKAADEHPRKEKAMKDAKE